MRTREETSRVVSYLQLKSRDITKTQETAMDNLKERVALRKKAVKILEGGVFGDKDQLHGPPGL